jgi:hypothetical protein
MTSDDASMNIQNSTSFPSFNLANLFKSLNVRSAQITMSQVTITADAAPQATQSPSPATTPTPPTTTTPATPVVTTPATPAVPATPATPAAPAPTRPADTTDISAEARDRCRCECGDDNRAKESRGYSPERLLRLADKFSSRAERLEARATKLEESGGDPERIEKLNRRAERYWKIAEKFASMVPGGNEAPQTPAPAPTPAPTPTPTPATKPVTDNTTLTPATRTQPLDLVA